MVVNGDQVNVRVEMERKTEVLWEYAWEEEGFPWIRRETGLPPTFHRSFRVVGSYEREKGSEGIWTLDYISYEEIVPDAMGDNHWHGTQEGYVPDRVIGHLLQKIGALNEDADLSNL